MAVLLVIYFLFRLPNLRDQVIFCDEATYLRWAQLVAQDPIHNLFISMEDAKLPLHYWLLALARPLSHDPVYAGRLLSVLFGACTLPVIFGLCGELSALVGTARWLGPLTAAIMIACPLMALHQRMALAEPLLLLESVLLAWQSLRVARLVRDNVPAGRLTRHALLLGVLWALVLLTKQNFSYALWVLPPAALLLTCSPSTWRAQLRSFMPRYAVATLIGLSCFVPVLLTSRRYDLTTRLFYKPSMVSSDHLSRWELLARNLHDFFLPTAGGHLQLWPYDPATPLDSGILYLYLTPPILLLALAGTIWLITRRQWRILGFIAVWCAALLGSVTLGANSLYSRYLMLGVFPLLILAAAPIAGGFAAARFRPVWGAVCLLALLWPALVCGRAALDAQAPVLTAADRSQYRTGSPAGECTQQAVAWLSIVARQHPITLVTGNELGLRNDFTWLMLSGRSDIQLYCDDSTPPLRLAPGSSSTFLACRRQWGFGKMEPVTLPPDRPVYYIADCHFDPVQGRMDLMPLRFFGPGAAVVQAFYNPPPVPGCPAEFGHVFYQLQRPASPSPIGAAAAAP